MATDKKGNKSAGTLHPMMSDYGMRAATALDLVVPGPHRDKTIANKLGVSLRHAKYLRAGRYWNIARLNQVSAIFGSTFDALLGSSATHYADMTAIAERLARVEGILDATAVGRTEAQPISPEVRPLHQSGEGRDAGRGAPQGHPPDRMGADIPDDRRAASTGLGALRREVAAGTAERGPARETR